MKFYLSSYKIGNKADELKKIENKKLAYIPNALDFATDVKRRKQSEEKDTNSLKELGFDIERVDLKDYFGKKEELKIKLKNFGIIWVRGGNAFILRRAMNLSEFDILIKDLIDKNNLVYAGFSAGICVLGPTLKGLDIMDDPADNPYNTELILDGLNLIDFVIVPHFDSDQPESENARKYAENLKSKGIKFKTLKDGDVIII